MLQNDDQDRPHSNLESLSGLDYGDEESDNDSLLDQEDDDKSPNAYTSSGYNRYEENKANSK